MDLLALQFLAVFLAAHGGFVPRRTIPDVHNGCSDEGGDSAA